MKENGLMILEKGLDMRDLAISMCTMDNSRAINPAAKEDTNGGMEIGTKVNGSKENAMAKAYGTLIKVKSMKESGIEAKLVGMGR